MTYSDNILKWLAAHRLIKNSLHCVNEEYSLNVYNDGVDGFRWYCKGCKNVFDIPFRISMEELPPNDDKLNALMCSIADLYVV
jgi:hypothetical protein